MVYQTDTTITCPDIAAVSLSVIHAGSMNN
jgi:hypothetical protein